MRRECSRGAASPFLGLPEIEPKFVGIVADLEVIDIFRFQGRYPQNFAITHSAHVSAITTLRAQTLFHRFPMTLHNAE